MKFLNIIDDYINEINTIQNIEDKNVNNPFIIKHMLLSISSGTFLLSLIGLIMRTKL